MEITVVTPGGTHTFPCAPDEKVLHAGLRAGVPLPYECATGTCGSCKARLVSGTVVSAWPGAPGARALKTADERLTCQSVAHTDCTLSVGAPRGARNDGGAPPPPQHLGGWLRHTRPLTPDVMAFEVELERALEFEAGQFALVTAPDIRGARAYSMIDAAPVARRLTFVVKRREGGAVGDWLWRGPEIVGSPLALFAPLGGATFHPRLQRNVLCLAGGTGVAGMLSILRRAAAEDHFARWRGDLVFGVRRARDVFFLDELHALRAGVGARLSIVVALSDEDVPAALAAAHPGLSFARGAVHEVAGRHVAGRFTDVRAWVAGPPPMVDASLRLLLTQGRLSPADIRFDKFT